MNLVISGQIKPTLIETIAKCVTPSRVVYLHPKAARFEHAVDSALCRRAVETICVDNLIDHAYVEEATQLKGFKLLAIDMDSTLITVECIDEIADFAGKRREVAEITAAAMANETPDFAESLRRRVRLLAGLDSTVLQRVFAERVRLSEGATDLLSALRSNGTFTMLLSGGFTYFTERLGKALEFSDTHANVLHIRNKTLCGTVEEPILDGAGKAILVADAIKRLRLTRDEALVIGDGANDIPMMQEVLHSVAYHAKPATAKKAKYSVNFGGLSTVLDYFSTGTGLA